MQVKFSKSLRAYRVRPSQSQSHRQEEKPVASTQYVITCISSIPAAAAAHKPIAI
jgi:hypothetical protein